MSLSYEHRVKEAKSRFFSPLHDSLVSEFLHWHYFFVNFILFHVYLVCEREFRHVWPLSGY